MRWTLGSADTPTRTNPERLFFSMLIASGVSGLLLGSLDFLSGVRLLWGADPEPVREYRSLTLACGYYAAAALLLHLVTAIPMRARRAAPEIGYLQGRVALLAGYLVTKAVETESVFRESILLFAVALPFAGLAVGTLNPQGARTRAVAASLDRLWTSGALGISSWVAVLAWVRIHAPDGGILMVRLGPILVASVVWLGSLAILHTSRARLVRGFAVVAFFILSARAGWLPAVPGILPKAPPPEIAEELSGILLITVDTLRADALGYYGEGGTSTPHIDGLARSGVTYRNAISPSAWTLPSVVSILTGTSVPVHGTTSLTTAVPESLPTLAEKLSARGWSTGAIGRNAFLVRGRGLSRGFETFEMFPQAPGLSWPTLGFRLLDLIPSTRGRIEASTPDLADLAIQWLKTRSNQPFFLWCHFFDPHAPYEPPEAFWPAGPAPGRLGYDLTEAQAIREGAWVPTEDERAWIRQLYLAEVRNVDAEIGRILEALERLDRRERTLIILTSDHGEEFWEHGGFEHGHSLYQELIRVPLIFSHPRLLRSGWVEPNVSTQSVYSTVLNLIDRDLQLDPIHAPPLPLPGKIDQAGAPVFSTGLLYGPDQEAVIDGPWKLMRGRSTEALALFDLAVDPREVENLASTSTGALQDSTRLLGEWRDGAELLHETLETGGESPVDLTDDQLGDLRRLGYIN